MFNSIPRAEILLSQETYLPKIAQYVKNKVNEYYQKQKTIPVCTLCLGFGYLKDGRSIPKYLLNQLIKEVSVELTYMFDRKEKFKEIAQKYYRYFNQLLASIEKKQSIAELQKCPRCNGVGTKVVNLKNFGNFFANLLLEENLLEKNIDSIIEKAVRHYIYLPNFTYDKYTNKDFRTTVKWQNKYLYDLSKEVTPAFTELIKRFSRVKTGAMKEGIYTKWKTFGHNIKEIIITTKARKVSRSYPEGFLYASVYSNFPDNIDKFPWNIGGTTTKGLYQVALNETVAAYKLKPLQFINTRLQNLLAVFNYQKN